jgi:hypothetical protein
MRVLKELNSVRSRNTNGNLECAERLAWELFYCAAMQRDIDADRGAIIADKMLGHWHARFTEESR